MTDKDEQLLEQFFKPLRDVEVPDAGFAERVMESLPEVQPDVIGRSSQRYAWLSRIWTTACVVLGCGLFVVADGWGLLWAALLPMVQAVPAWMLLLVLLGGLFLTGFWLIGETLRRDRQFVTYLSF